MLGLHKEILLSVSVVILKSPGNVATLDITICTSVASGCFPVALDYNSHNVLQQDGFPHSGKASAFTGNDVVVFSHVADPKSVYSKY